MKFPLNPFAPLVIAVALRAPAIGAVPLPDLFTAVDGTPIRTAEDWMQQRRPETENLE